MPSPSLCTGYLLHKHLLCVTSLSLYRTSIYRQHKQDGTRACSIAVPRSNISKAYASPTQGIASRRTSRTITTESLAGEGVYNYRYSRPDIHHSISRCHTHSSHFSKSSSNLLPTIVHAVRPSAHSRGSHYPIPNQPIVDRAIFEPFTIMG